MEIYINGLAGRTTNVCKENSALMVNRCIARLIRSRNVHSTDRINTEKTGIQSIKVRKDPDIVVNHPESVRRRPTKWW